ncbi:hypothetical protein LTR53_012675 [Teratosphaeriaceae sp. CCFEE 6253]|nr:hypothetical protein LTR53_012675 [Teratosphaeriaceae sp. CCFEE 6253]
MASVLPFGTGGVMSEPQSPGDHHRAVSVSDPLSIAFANPTPTAWAAHRENGSLMRHPHRIHAIVTGSFKPAGAGFGGRSYGGENAGRDRRGAGSGDARRITRFEPPSASEESAGNGRDRSTFGRQRSFAREGAGGGRERTSFARRPERREDAFDGAEKSDSGYVRRRTPAIPRPSAGPITTGERSGRFDRGESGGRSFSRAERTQPPPPRSSAAEPPRKPLQVDPETAQQIDEAFGVVRHISEVVSEIQGAEHRGPVPAETIAEAREKIAELNSRLPERTLLGERGSLKREAVYYVRRTMEKRGLYVNGTGERADRGEVGKTVMAEKAGHEFALVMKGERVDDAIVTRAAGGKAWRGDGAGGRREGAAVSQRAGKEVEDMDAEVSSDDPLTADLRRMRKLLGDVREAGETGQEASRSGPSGTEEKVKEIRSLLAKLGYFDKVDETTLQRTKDMLKKGRGFRAVRNDSGDGKVDSVVFWTRGQKDEFRLAVGADETAEQGGRGQTLTPAARPSTSPAPRTAAVDAVPKRTTKQDRVAASPPAPQAADEADEDSPVSIPYTTAASSFLYGTNVVLAALRAQRRKLYRLHLHPRIFSRESAGRDIVALAEEAGIPIARNADIKLLDRMAEDRPHNGVVLEASRLPAPPVLSLGSHNTQDANGIPLLLDRQDQEDAAVNGTPTTIPSTAAATTRHPFVILLDGIVDPGNLGAILRSAHFYGVDAVAVATGTCCSLTSAVLAKASSGACEAVPLLAIPKPSAFVTESRKAGWKIYAAVAPVEDGSRDAGKQATTASVAAHGPLRTEPVVLMLGAEGEGLRFNLVRQADHLLSIETARQGDVGADVGVDSLNVSVAAGVLMEAFLRRASGEAAGARTTGVQENNGGEAAGASASNIGDGDAVGTLGF